MIAVRLINSGASLNSFFEISSVNYTPGENLTMVLRLFDEQLDNRFIPDATATLTLTYTDTSDVEQTKAASLLDADDRSLWTITWSQAETAAFGSTGFTVTMDAFGDTNTIYITTLPNVLTKQIISGDC